MVIAAITMTMAKIKLAMLVVKLIILVKEIDTSVIVSHAVRKTLVMREKFQC